MKKDKIWPVIVVGAGPCGIAAAAELKKLGIDSLIIEKGAVTESIRNYPLRMIFFSTAENIEIADIPFATSNVKANRNEALQYYRKVALFYKLNLVLNCEVQGIKKNSTGLFQVESGKGMYQAEHVVLATGYFDVPRMLNVPGEDLPNVTHYYREPYAHSFQKVTIVGGGNSAIEAALELYRHDVEVTMLVRGESLKPTAKYWLVPDITNRIKEGKIKLITSAVVNKIELDRVYYQDNENKAHSIESNFVYALIGYLPNAELLSNCGLDPDPKSITVNFDKATYETEISNLFLCGTVMSGVRTEKVFIENGREHAKIIAKEIFERVPVA